MTYFQLARSRIAANIASAFRKTGLQPYDPDLVLKQFQPKTTTDYNDSSEATVNIAFKIAGSLDDIEAKVDDIITQIEQSLETPVRSDLRFIRQTCLTALAECHTLNTLNKSLVQKARESRVKKARKAAGEARVLTVQEIVEKQARRDAQDDVIKAQRQRATALRGKIGFSKVVWREFKMDVDVFT